MYETGVKATVKCIDRVAGRTSHFIIDSEVGELTGLVVSLLGETKGARVVPAHMIRHLSRDVVSLSCSAQKLWQLQPFQRLARPADQATSEASQTHNKGSNGPQRGPTIRYMGLLENEIVLDEHTRIASTDGIVGRLVALSMDEDSLQVTQIEFVLGPPWVPSRCFVPVSHIARWTQGTVHLALERAEVHMLDRTAARRAL